MIINEIRKMMKGMTPIIVIFLIGFICMLLTIKKNYRERDVQYYKLYINKLEGFLTPDKAEYIEEEYKAVVDLIQESYSMPMLSNGIDYEKLDYAFKHEQAFKMIYERYEYIRDMEDESEQFFYYDLEWRSFLEKTNINYFEIFLLIALPLYAIVMEFSDRRDSMIKTSYRGRLSFILSKQGAVMLLVLLIRALFFIAEVLYIVFRLGVDSLSYPVRSMKMFSTLEINLNIGQYIIISELYHMLWCVVTALIMVLIGQMTRKLQSGLFIGLVSVILPITIKDYISSKYWVWLYGINMVKNDSVCKLWITGAIEALLILVALLIVNSYTWSKSRRAFS